MDLINKINKDNIPSHVAVIMDGNGRWANSKGEHRVYGHRSGVSSVREITEAADDIGVKYVTLYAFSTENWGRPEFEVNALMGLFVETLEIEIPKMLEKNVQLKFIGDIEGLPEANQNIVKLGVEATKNNTGLVLTLAINYSSRQEILNAVRNIANQVADGNITPEDISEDLFSKSLYTSEIPDPELLIRTSGEERISNYLLWQIAYSELLFTDTHWPDFKREDFFKAIYDYQQRQRRFGKTGEQVG